MAVKVLWQGSLTAPQAKHSCQQSQLQLATAGVTPARSARRVRDPGAAGVPQAARPPQLPLGSARRGPGPEARTRPEGQSSRRNRERKTKRGRKEEESKRGKQLVVMASLQQEMTRTTYISDLCVNCKWERHSKEPAVDLMS